MTVSPSEFADESYKKHLGGGAAQWGPRGAFQLHFLRLMGLRPSSKLLDLGCGPLRGGAHLIDFLDAGNYHGVDANRDFVTVARQIIHDRGLAAKHPRVDWLDDFDLSPFDTDFDFVLLFSVLNHCDAEGRSNFYARIGGSICPGAKIYVTHARHFQPGMLADVGLSLNRQFCCANDIARGLDLTKWGWSAREQESVFPILELTRS